MQPITITTIIYIFSVVIPIQSHETVYIYKYDSFGEIFPQGDGIHDFHLRKYADMDTIFDTEYTGTNIGGAYLLHGASFAYTPDYEGFIVDITATFYCGSTYAEDGVYTLLIDVLYIDDQHLVDQETTYICEEKGWNYNYTLFPRSAAKYQTFGLFIQACNATINKAYGFDELRIKTSTTPPQFLQRDNASSNEPWCNTSSNDPCHNISSNDWIQRNIGLTEHSCNGTFIWRNIHLKEPNLTPTGIEGCPRIASFHELSRACKRK